MIDTHCHLLPALDDGPESVEESLAFARALLAAGVSEVVCTPHLSRRYPTGAAAAADRFEEFARLLDEHRIRLPLMLGAEVSPAAAAELPLDALRERMIGPRHLLVELEPDTPAGIVPIVQARLRGADMRPVFAHPERCRAVRDQLHVIDAARADGALVQVVLGSLARGFGAGTREAAWRLLATGRADLLASDAHRAEHAGERMGALLAEVGGRIGAAALAELTEAAPARVTGSLVG